MRQNLISEQHPGRTDVSADARGIAPGHRPGWLSSQPFGERRGPRVVLDEYGGFEELDQHEWDSIRIEGVRAHEAHEVLARLISPAQVGEAKCDRRNVHLRRFTADGPSELDVERQRFFNPSKMQ